MSEALEVDQATAFVLNEQQAKIANAYTERLANLPLFQMVPFVERHCVMTGVE